MNSANYINHMAFVVDESGSMDTIAHATVEVFDRQIKHLAKRSEEMKQETRVSVYLFSVRARCIIFDMDVMRLPSLADLYRPDGGTALIDATMLSITDLKKTAQMYGDHAFLIYCLTDGRENSSTFDPEDLKAEISALPDNWTMAALVPDASGVHEAKGAGFSKENIMTWDATGVGIEEIGRKMEAASEAFMVNRAKGVRGTRSLFVLDTSHLSSKKVNDSLDSLKKGEFLLLDVKKDSTIRDFVEANTKGEYVKGSAFYQLTKPEVVQAYKKVCIRNKNSGYVYAGDKARELLGLPDHELKLKPEDLSKFDIFVQSTSVNRKLIGRTQMIVLKNP